MNNMQDFVRRQQAAGTILISHTLRTQWRLRNFSTLSKQPQCSSGLFFFSYENFCLRLFPGDPICVFIEKETSSRKCRANCQLGYKKLDGTFKIVEEFTHTFTKDMDRRGCFYPKRSELEEDGLELAEADFFTIMLCMQTGDLRNRQREPEPNAIFGIQPQDERHFGKIYGPPRFGILRNNTNRTVRPF